jgi:LacI family transcriptional regulator
VKRVTIRDVAAAASVSVATASRALAGTRNVAPDIAARVAETADSLGYRRNALAGAMRSQTTGMIGMVVPQIANPFFPLIIDAVERRLGAQGRDLLLCDSRDDPQIEAHRIRALLERRVDGLIVSPCDAELSVTALSDARSTTALVQLDRYASGHLSDWVGLDDSAGIGRIIEHLYACGARTFAFVSAEPTNSSAVLRLAAYQSHAGRIDRSSAERCALGEFTTDWGQKAAAELVASGDLPDAVVCGNDITALGVLHGLQTRGVAVPARVMVSGYDDIGFALLSVPALTTMRQPYEQMAEECVRLLDGHLANSGSEQLRHVAIAPTLVVRDSTRAVPPIADQQRGLA